jgi:hypothetical protein
VCASACFPAYRPRTACAPLPSPPLVRLVDPAVTPRVQSAGATKFIIAHESGDAIRAEIVVADACQRQVRSPTTGSPRAIHSGWHRKTRRGAID